MFLFLNIDHSVGEIQQDEDGLALLLQLQAVDAFTDLIEHCLLLLQVTVVEYVPTQIRFPPPLLIFLVFANLCLLLLPMFIEIFTKLSELKLQFPMRHLLHLILQAFVERKFHFAGCAHRQLRPGLPSAHQLLRVVEEEKLLFVQRGEVADLRERPRLPLLVVLGILFLLLLISVFDPFPEIMHYLT